ncbi:retinoid-inducible serine carboxypeptidase-like [Eriocheir sinensis]|uniref:retinoid-inducible serine carboxypeptidase-like n=1 Tax=Eriocheir sinensis TaxID=95602 RepID=UPI0021C67088|nr:retinoid-inducible serine carboxypeptidase-like [Eriocheir sinensis]
MRQLAAEGARPSPVAAARPSSRAQFVYTGAAEDMGRQTLALLFLALLAASSTHGSRRDGGGLGEAKESWGYVSVRPGAHMFFWLYYTTATGDYRSRPLVVWLQGGPGASSTGIGNFLEIGPQDASLKNRTNAWTKEVNVLFVDNPVGTGYSYVQDPKLLPTNNSAIATDLVNFMGAFFKKVPEFEKVPLYIFTESYGGKMGARFAQALSKAVLQKKVRCQLAGLVMGDSWISPVDAVKAWGPYLYATSLIDSAGMASVDAKTDEVAAAVKAGKMTDSTKLWGEAEQLIERVTNGVNFYNILKTPNNSSTANHITGTTTPLPIRDNHTFKTPEVAYLYYHHVGRISATLDALMNGPIKQKLKVVPANVTWGGQSEEVFDALSADFMTSAIPNVEMLLNTTSLKVVVYNGQLDLIVCTPGAQKWVENMHWAGTKQWVQSTRKPMVDSTGGTMAFSKSFKNFSFYWILNAGHMVPADASDVAMRVMEEIVGTKK